MLESGGRRCAFCVVFFFLSGQSHRLPAATFISHIDEVNIFLLNFQKGQLDKTILHVRSHFKQILTAGKQLCGVLNSVLAAH